MPLPVKTMMRKQWATMIKGPDGKPVYVSK
jgi:hypothetical protein